MASESIQSPEQSVARIAYLASDAIVSVQSSAASGTSFASQLETLTKHKVQAVISRAVPEVHSVRQNNDPLLSVFPLLEAGKRVSVLASDAILVPSLPHIYKLANKPVIIHVAVGPSRFPDLASIASIRNSGWTFLQSQGAQEAQDIALTAHVLAARSGKAVLHFFGLDEKTQAPMSVDDLQPALVGGVLGRTGPKVEPAIAEVSGWDSRAAISEAVVASNEAAPVPALDSAPADSVPISTLEDILSSAMDIWKHLEAETGRSYSPFEYSGARDARYCIVVFGSSASLLSQSIRLDDDLNKTVGVLTARLYRPWLGRWLTEAVPRSVKRVAVLEQLHKKTTKWGPTLLDVLSSLHGGREGAEVIVGHQLGYIGTQEAARGVVRQVVENLDSATPAHGIIVGDLLPPATTHGTETSPSSGAPPLESAYTNILGRLFEKRLYLANALTSEHVGLSPTISSSPEFGFGSLLARQEHHNRFVSQVKEMLSAALFTSDATRELLIRWSTLALQDIAGAGKLADDVIAQLETDGSSATLDLLKNQQLFRNESLWLLGSDVWAYDLGNSGVHHVLASGRNVNMLIIDSTPYSDRAATDAARRKKDIGLYAMNFGNAYVASVAVYGSYTQVLQAMLEADKFDGPSIVLAYLPTFGENDSALTALQETKRAVDVGYWPLYRWNPANESTGQPVFSLDSARIRQELKTFLARDNQLTQIMKAKPSLSTSLNQDFGAEVRHAQRRKAKDAYDSLLEGLVGAPLLILFASDNGAAASVAKRVGKRGRGRGLKTQVMAMEDYPVEDMPTEQNVVFITSTAGQGEFPQNGRVFWEAIKDNTSLDLATVRYSVFGLGDSHYWPRKEDRIYYNKPAVDLDRVLGNLGARKLVDVGLGDDQDPDGYETAYREWEPRLWDALNVGGQINGHADDDEPPPITNEDIKLASNYLRGTIKEGLQDTTTGAISAADQQLTKFHGTYMQDDRDIREERKAQGLEPAYSFMIRCRLPGGVATPKQWLQMDDISTALGNETMKLTTRQTFQFHGVIKAKLKPAMQAINRALMTTLAACGDVNRNVMCSPLPSQSRFHREVYACSQRISDHLLPSTNAYHEIWLTDDTAVDAGDGDAGDEDKSQKKKVLVAGDALQDFEPLYGPLYLPRKFKITIAIPPHNDTDVYAHDIGLIAIKNADGQLAGFNLLAGGGMGATHNNKKTYPQLGRMFGFVGVDEIHRACEHIMTVQRDFGDRKNRKHARLKYTIDDMGVDAFKAHVEERWGQTFKPPRPFEFESNVDVFGWQRDEAGMNHFTIFIENGRVEDAPGIQLKTGLRELAKLHKGEFRLTPNQHVIVSNVADEDLDAIKSLFKQYGLDNYNFSGLRLSSSACVAFPTCGLAMAESERYLPELITKLESCLEENGLRQDSIVMRMTGCPNGCARPWVAEVAFVGKAYGAYNMYLGGGYYGQRLNKLYRSSIKEDEILVIMKALLKRYALERDDDERFGDFCIRIGVIKPTQEGRNFHDNIAEDESDE